MTVFADRGKRFVAENVPTAEAAFLGGSAATQRATDSSDLDILVVLADDRPEAGFVETT